MSDKNITVGLTGGIASGKSTVTKTFRVYDIPVVDADIVAREVVEVGKPTWKLIVDCFGHQYLNEDQTINRSKLAELVFNDFDAMQKINLIMNPAINEEAEKQIKALHDAGNQIIVWDAALIVEMGNAKKYKPLIVVECPRETQLARLMKRNSLTEDQANARLNAQMSLEDKLKHADYVINTQGSIESSIAQTERIIAALRYWQL